MLTAALCWSINHTHKSLINQHLHSAQCSYVVWPRHKSPVISVTSHLLLLPPSHLFADIILFPQGSPAEVIPSSVPSPSLLFILFLAYTSYIILSSSALPFFSSPLLLTDVTWSQRIRCHFSAVIKVQLTAVHSGVWWQDERETESSPSSVISSSPLFLPPPPYIFSLSLFCPSLTWLDRTICGHSDHEHFHMGCSDFCISFKCERWCGQQKIPQS